MINAIKIFAGPTLFGTGLLDQNAPGVEWLPPVRRGDVEQLLTNKTPVGSMAIVDGTFHSYPSVSHHELRHAIEAGWTIYGLSSMGAIRACEMAHLGMRPWGQVAQRYLDDADFNDDEVTLVHGVEAPYVPLSEPLIHMREFLHSLKTRGLVSEAQEAEVLKQLQPRWYAERTIPELRRALEKTLTTLPTEVLVDLKNFTPYRVKQRDLQDFVRERPWAAVDNAPQVSRPR